MPQEGTLEEKAAHLLLLAHLLNLNPAGYTLTYIKDYFECTNKTARSYIDALNSIGFHIQEIPIQDEDHKSLFKLIRMPEKFPSSLKVSCDVILPFYFLLFSAAQEIRGTYLEELAREASMFFEPFLLDSPYVIASHTYKAVDSMEEFIKRAKRLFVNHTNLWHVSLKPANDQLKALINASLKQKECRIRYSSFSEKKTLEWKIQPIHFIRYKDSLVLLALLPEYEDQARIFITKRIISVKELDSGFDYPDNIDLHRLLSESPKSYYGPTGGSIINIILWIDPEIAWIVRDYDWGRNKVIREIGKKGRDGIEMSFNAPYNYELKSSILSLGSKARVIEPRELRHEISLEVSKMIDLYAEK